MVQYSATKISFRAGIAASCHPTIFRHSIARRRSPKVLAPAFEISAIFQVSGSRFLKGASMRVLIIEDDRNMAGLLQKGLEEENHIVSLAIEGRTGLELAESYQFDVIVLDWMLPDTPGLSFARKLRAESRSRKPSARFSE